MQGESAQQGVEFCQRPDIFGCQPGSDGCRANGIHKLCKSPTDRAGGFQYQQLVGGEQTHVSSRLGWAVIIYCLEE
jgi:hypothetical protein